MNLLIVGYGLLINYDLFLFFEIMYNFKKKSLITHVLSRFWHRRA